MRLTTSTVLMHQQYILNKEPLNRNMHERKLCSQRWMEMSRPEICTNLALHFPWGRQNQEWFSIHGSVFANSVFPVTLYKAIPRITRIDSQWIQNLFLRSRGIKHLLALSCAHDTAWLCVSKFPLLRRYQSDLQIHSF